MVSRFEQRGGHNDLITGIFPRVALGVTAVAEFSGPFIFGVAVLKP